MDDTIEGQLGPNEQPPAAPRIHNGTFTVQNEKSGNHRTFRIRTAGPQSKLAGKRIIEVRMGDSYNGVAFLDDVTAVVWKKHRGPGSSGAVRLGEWDSKAWSKTEKSVAILLDLAEMTCAGKPGSFWYGEGFRLEFAGTCVRCNRELTDPESIRLGIGPTCRAKS